MQKIHLYKHQSIFIDDPRPRLALMWETGTGKSLAAISKANKIGLPVLFICPKALKTKWLLDVDKFCAVPFKVLTKEEFKKHHETLEPYGTIVIDEAHNHLGMSSQISKATREYMKVHRVHYRYFLSATMYRSSAWDVYKLYELLNGKPLNFMKFRQNFFFEVSMGMRKVWLPKINKRDELISLVQGVSSIVKLEDCVDVPEQTFETIYVSLTKEQKKAIDSLLDIVPIAVFTKQHQLCGGTLKADDFSDALRVKTEKADLLLEYAKANDKLIIVSRYREEMNYIEQLLRDAGHESICQIHGDTKEKHELLTKMRASDKALVIVNAACAEGWEFPECATMIFWSYDFSLVKYIQMLGRIQRINHVKKNVYISLVTKGTIDEDIYKTIMNKKDFHINLYSGTEV